MSSNIKSGSLRKTGQINLLICAVICTAVISTLILMLAPYIVPVDDDYCFVAYVRDKESFLDFFLYWETTWSGRWLGTTIRYFYFNHVGTEASPWLVPTLLISILLGTIFLTRGLYGKGRNSLIAGLLATSIFFLVMGKPAEMLYWPTAAFVYTCSGQLFPDTSLRSFS
jgi:hypothetical protein